MIDFNKIIELWVSGMACGMGLGMIVYIIGFGIGVIYKVLKNA